MGREIRRVPPNWVHPKDDSGVDQPMFDMTFMDAAKQWKEDFAAWERGERSSYFEERDGEPYEFWEYNENPPNRKYYRPWADQEATWFQLWQTVSEGSPVSPPFATMEELIQHLAKHGDDWDAKRGHGGWGVDRARAFCADGWAPSMAITDGKIMEGTEIALYEQQRKAVT